MTVPEMGEHRVHRYDLLLKKMASVSPLNDLEGEIANTLKSGNRLWFVGQAELPPPGKSPIQLTPAPDSKFGWQGLVYRKAWTQEIGLFLSEHVTRANVVTVPARQLISERENMMLYELEGWKY